MMKRNVAGILILVFALTAGMFGAACSKGSAGMTPTEVFKAYYDAAAKKDYASMKKYLSKGSIDLMEMGAKQSGKSFEEAMKDSPVEPMPQLGNEKINGDTATVDITADGHKAAMPFIKENGEWKIAMDKLAMTMMSGENAPATTNAPATQSAPSTMSTPSNEKEHDEADNDNANH